MIRWPFAVTALFFCLFSFAQEKMLSIEDAMLNARTTLAPENLRYLQFIRGTAEFAWMKKIDGVDTWVKSSYMSPVEMPLTNLRQINEALRRSSLDTAATMPAIQFFKDKWIMTQAGQRLSYNPESGLFTVLIDKATLARENVDMSSAGFIAYVDKDNLFVSGNGKSTQVTTDGSDDIVYASSVHQSEFGINKGTFWSNAGNKLAFYRMDQTMVPEYPITDWTTRPAKNKPIRYPMAGDSSHHVTVGIFDAKKLSTVWLQTGEPKEKYLTNIAWSPDDRFVFITVVNREQNHFWLNQYDASSGAFVKTLFEETHDKYVEPLIPMLFNPVRPTEFVWQSRRDGWNHLYLYDITGKLIRQLTSGNWEVTEVKGFNNKGSQLFYVSTVLSPVDRVLSVVDMKTFASRVITPETGVHQTQVSTDGDWVIDNYADVRTPRVIRIMPVKRPLIQKPRTLLTAADPLAAYKLGELSVFKRSNGKGADLYYRTFKPVAFDSTKKYPVIVYWYGGPHAQMILNNWNGGAGDYWFQYLAQQGYLVLTIDTRGSAYRGREFEQSIFRQAGKAQMEDLGSAVNYLSSLSYADTSRMGLFGWSYGGFMTTSFLLNNPGVFKAAVAGGPVMDWKYYEIMYTERYMDRPQENPEGYDQTNLIKQAGKLKGRLLLIHGMQDPVVLMQHSVLFVKAAIDKGVQVDYMIYPGHEHNVLGKDRAHLYRKVTDYLFQQLNSK